uniref:RNA polymerase II subunit B1 CTD phosphatase RPAP2 homolog n=1 Tax=Anopheles christyi TaxID=43041 RepID=A0A182K0M9_9DIPT
MVSMFRDRLLTSDSSLRTSSELHGDGSIYEETLVEESIASCTATSATSETMEQNPSTVERISACRCSDCGKQINETEPTYLFQHNFPSDTTTSGALCQECYQRLNYLNETESSVEKGCPEEAVDVPALVIDLLPLDASNVRFCCVTHCSQSFVDEAALIAHAQEIHAIKLRKNRENQEPGRPFKCQVCFRAFGSSKNLRVHQLKFARKRNMKEHLQMCHSDEKPYTCSECSARFKTMQHLRLHQRLHTGEKPYACSLCPKKHKPKEPATRVNRASLPRRARNFSKEQLQKALRKKKECNDKAQRVVETLIEPGRTEDELLTMLQDINQCHMEDIIQERAIVKLCGYPLCDNELKNIPKQQYVISVTQNKVFDITERKNFCSGECYKASNYIKQQMLTSPLWLRDQEDVPKFRLINGRQLIYRETDVKKPLQPEDVLFGELKIVERSYAPEQQEAILKQEPEQMEQGVDEAGQTSAALQEVVGLEETLDSVLSKLKI